MSNQAIIARPRRAVALPTVRKIGLADLKDALEKGLADFLAKPSHMMFLCVIYPVVGILIARVAMKSALLPLFFPLAAGYALLGPFAALGLYEASRRREMGVEPSWVQVFEIKRSPALREIAGVGLVLAAVFVAWLGAAQAIYNLTLGPASPATVGQFARETLTTPAGWTLIVVGNAVGLVFAALALTLGVVSFPLLLDKNVGFGTAITTSVRCVLANPLVLSVWGLVVAGALVIGTIPLFVGLAIVLPVLGHATWHLYRKLVQA